jgi:hypothetical protein
MNSSKFIAQSTLTKINANNMMYYSDMALEGFTAYDSHIAEPVLVHSVVLCFLADSPMHAEVTNTPNPGQSNHPCRMCTLSVEKKSMMKSVPYIQHFIQVDHLGYGVRGACPFTLLTCRIDDNRLILPWLMIV